MCSVYGAICTGHFELVLFCVCVENIIQNALVEHASNFMVSFVKYTLICERGAGKAVK